MITTMVIDEAPLLRAALQHAIEAHPQFAVVAQGTIDVSALASVRQHKPVIVVMHLDAGLSQSLQLVDRLRKSHPDISVLGVMGQVDHPILRRLLEVGVRGLLSKKASEDQLHSMLIQLARGERVISPDIAQHLAMSTLPSEVSSPFETLTTRELEVGLSLIEGERMPAIARRLNVSPKTVATYKYRIYEKLNLDTEVALLKMAMRHGLVDLDPPVTQSKLF